MPRLSSTTAGLLACFATQSSAATVSVTEPEPLQSRIRSATRCAACKDTVYHALHGNPLATHLCHTPHHPPWQPPLLVQLQSKQRGCHVHHSRWHWHHFPQSPTQTLHAIRPHRALETPDDRQRPQYRVSKWSRSPHCLLQAESAHLTGRLAGQCGQGPIDQPQLPGDQRRWGGA